MTDHADPKIRAAIEQCMQRCLAVSWPRFELTSFLQDLEQDRNWSREDIEAVENDVAMELVKQGRA